MIDLTEVREMGDDELFTRVAEAKQELFNLRFQHVTGQLDNYSRLGDVRRDVARLHTILREREIEAAEAAEREAAGLPPKGSEQPGSGTDDREQDEGRRRRRARVAASRRAGKADAADAPGKADAVDAAAVSKDDSPAAGEENEETDSD